MKNMRVTVFGGSGFLGTQVVKQLADHGALVHVVCRHPENAKHLRVNGPTGRVVITGGNIRDEKMVKRAVQHADVVINLVGILYQRGKQRFDLLQAQAAERIAQCAKEAKVKRLIHISALGVDKPSKSHYARSKKVGEQAVINAFPTATIIRPSVIFGPGDNFFNMFARMTTYSPFLPLIGGGKSMLQPVYVGDVAKAIYYAATHDKTQGHIYELGGPDIVSFKDIMVFVKRHTKRNVCLLPLPFSLASLIAPFMELAPAPLLTRDQVRLLRIDNVVTEGSLGLKNLGIAHPVTIEALVPNYIEHFQP